MTVDMVHIHHEGGGAPTTAAGCERFRHGGYCYGIGTDTFVRWCSPEDGYATADWNGRDLTFCFSGDRHTGYEVTDHDIEVIHAAFMDSFNRGEVTAMPQVVAHRDAGGSNATACPGDKAMRRMGDITNACRATHEPPKPEPEDDDVTDLASAINHDGRPVIFQVGGDKKLYMRIRDREGGGWGDWKDLSGGFKDFATVTAFVNKRETGNTIEVWVTMVDGKSFHKWQTGSDLAGWSAWSEVTR